MDIVDGLEQPFAHHNAYSVVLRLESSNAWYAFLTPLFEVYDQLRDSSFVICSSHTHYVVIHRENTTFLDEDFC